MDNLQLDKPMFNKLCININFFCLLLLVTICFTTSCHLESKDRSDNLELKQEKFLDNNLDNKEQIKAEKIVTSFIELSIKKEKEKALELKAKNKPTDSSSLPNSNNSTQYASKGSSVKGALDFLSVFPLFGYEKSFVWEKFNKDTNATVFVTFTNPNQTNNKVYMRFFLIKEDREWKIEEVDSNATSTKNPTNEKLQV